MKRKIINFSVGFIVISCLFGVYKGYQWKEHASETPENTIKLYLASEGHIIDAIRADVKISTEEDAPWNGKYYCENVKNGPDFYAMCQNKSTGKWFINFANSGGA